MKLVGVILNRDTGNATAAYANLAMPRRAAELAKEISSVRIFKFVATYNWHRAA